jgi:hypothetical protein
MAFYIGKKFKKKDETPSPRPKAWDLQFENKLNP